VGLDAEPFGQRPEDVLPLKEAVGVEVQVRVFLNANEGGEVIGERAGDGVSRDATAVDPSGGRDDLLRTGINTVLIGKDVDAESLDEGPPPP
jgi:hypothetical protein